MTKSEIKPGMFVKLRDGTIFLVDVAKILTNILNVESISMLDFYHENLKHDYDSDYDIIEVYSGVESFKKVWTREDYKCLEEEKCYIKLIFQIILKK